ncbi:hypothetical protein [Streptomyces erythrochromogenes]|uniref:hypothetical protein n=1 Tax=Streptomyces erythrochromogenes TaxID=285574 RepID=UPI003862EFD5|nr:hypothetical protein OG364_10205 [Streptomyces erythrochromogenes]
MDQTQDGNPCYVSTDGRGYYGSARVEVEVSPMGAEEFVLPEPVAGVGPVIVVVPRVEELDIGVLDRGREDFNIPGERPWSVIIRVFRCVFRGISSCIATTRISACWF